MRGDRTRHDEGVRTLTDPGTGKSWSIGVNGGDVTVVTGGKTRTRSFGTADEAREKASSDTWTKLKAGFVYADPASVPESGAASEPAEFPTPTADPGPRPAVLLRHAGKGFSWLGDAALCASEEDEAFFAVSMIGGANLVRRIDPDGTLTEVAELPAGRMVRSLSWYGDHLYADVDGQIMRIDPANADVENLTDVPFLLGGSLRLAENLGVWHDGQDVGVTNLDTGDAVWRRPVETGQWQGHTPMLAMAVSTTHVAWCNDAETIRIVSLADGAEATLHKPAPELTDQLWLTETGHLFTAGPYSTMARYDLASGQREWTLTSQGGASDSVAEATESTEGAGATEGADITNISMNRARTRLAVLMRAGTELRVIDAHSTATLDRLSPEYVVRSGGTAFTAAGLAVSTDYGCLARYRLHSR